MKRFGLLMILLSGGVADASAAVRASLDRDHVVLGDSITLTIASDASDAQPDLAPLRVNFEVRGSSTSSQTNIANGSMQSSTQWSVALLPRRSGVIDIPALTVGRERTEPLRVGVAAQADAATGASAASGAPVFIETAVEPSNPYVQQAIVYTERLYYAVALLDGALDAPKPDNGDARQIGGDATNSVMLQGHRYNVLERHYLLQPEHSGALHIPAPGFVGRSMGDVNNVFDDGDNVRVAGKQLDLQVRARPPQASEPWLPARSLAMSVEPPSAPLHAGEPFSIVVKLSGDGATAAQLPEIVLPMIAGMQIYPEPSSTAERLRDGRPQAERTRRFAIVPERAGALRLPELSVPWWDVVNDRAAIARLGMPVLQVMAGVATQANVGSAAARSGNAVNASTALAASEDSVVRDWKIATLSLAILLALSLWWGWRRGQYQAMVDAPENDAATRAPSRARTLSRALALGDASAIVQALLEATPGALPRNLGEVAQRLDDPAQRAAVQAFDAARWSADGAPFVQVLAQLRVAFKQPPHWVGRAPHASGDDGLPPLYPS